MVSIVTGNGLGLQSSSALGLGNNGKLGNASFGQTGEQIYVNAATGNLVIQDRDQMLLGQGLNGAVYRAYNSLGQVTGDNWRPGGMRTVTELTGAVNTAGSTITLTDWDGSTTVFAYDVARKTYVSTAANGANVTFGEGAARADVVGTGARATLSFDSASNAWLWRDGASELAETYDASLGGRLVSSRDRDGNAVSYVYNAAGKLSQVITAGGDVTNLDYNAAGQLTALRSVYRNTNGQIVTSTAVRYAYDTQGRLSQVIVDLSPDDNSIADGRVFKTTYTYDGASNRIASITQSDGAQVLFGYQLIDGDYRVVTISERGDGGALRVTKLSYDTKSKTTTITDPLGYAKVMQYDEQGRLTSIESVAGVDVQREFLQINYDNGEMLQEYRTDGKLVTLLFDAAGNLIRQFDSSADVTRTYGQNNELLTETVTDNNDPAHPKRTIRYVYDANGHLRFVVSGEGRVTEYRYNAAGQRTSEIQYTGGAYDLSGLSEQNALNETQVNAWRATIDPRDARRADLTYDYRGNIASMTRYVNLLADGSGDLSGEISQSHYVYDAFGRLLQHIEGVPGQERVEQFAYDGMGRLLSSTNFAGVQTLYQYDDAKHTVAIRFSNGLTRTSTYNAVGELIAVTDSLASKTVSQTKSAYDPNGRLRMTTDELGRNTHYLYNSGGQVVARIEPDGTMTEYVYAITTGLLTRTVTYETRLSAAQLASLVNANGTPVVTTADTGAALTLTTSKLRPVASAGDRSVWAYYNDGAIDHVVDADGVVTQTKYDGYGRPIAVTVFANRVTINGARPLSDLPDPDLADRTTRYFYDGDGLLVGELDAAGYLTEYRYNGAGERIETIRYANATVATLRATGSLNQLRPTGQSPDVHVNYVYDGQGRLAAEVDGEGYVTRYRYDTFGNVIERIRGQRIDSRQLTAPQQMTVNFQAMVTSAVSVDIVVDGVRAGTVSVKPGTTSYTATVSNAVPLANHTIEFRYNNAGGTVISSVTLDNQQGQSIPVTPWFVTGAAGSVAARFTFDVASALARASTPGELERTTYVYDAMGHLVERTAYSGTGNDAAQYAYDDQGNLIRESQGGRTLSYRYDEQGRLVGQLTGEGTVSLQALGSNPTQTQINNVWSQYGVTYRYDAAGNRMAMVDATGKTTLYYYDTAGRLSHIVNPVGEVVAYTYDTFGDLSATTVYATRVTSSTLSTLKGGALTDALGQTFLALGNDGQASITTFDYSAAGRLTRRTDAEGFNTIYEYNAFGERTSVVQDISEGVRVRESSAFDKRGNMVVRQNYDVGGLNLLTSVVYDAFGRVVQSTDANGVVRAQQYDRNGNVVVVTDGTGAQSKLTYDAFGNVLKSTDRTGQTTSYSYTPFNREISVTTPDGVRVTTRYDELGQMVGLTDGRGNGTSYRYDLDGNLVEVTTPAGTTAQKYDAAGHLIEVTDSRGIKTLLSYDAAGRMLTRTVDPSGLKLVTTYTYDAKGQVIGVKDPSGMVTQTRYDRNGQTVSVVQDPGGLNLTTTFTYNGLGNVLTVTEGAGSAVQRMTENVYDKAGRLVSTTVDPGGLKLKTTYAYDKNGNVLTAADAAGGVTRYAYDTEGRQIWAVGPTGAVVAQEYDAEGRVALRRAYANAVSLSGLPNPATAQDLAARVSATALDHIERYAYDSVGRLVYVIDGLNNVTGFTYDANGNVTSATRYAGTVAAGGVVTLTNVKAALQASAQDRVTRTVFDATNRPVFVIDSLGYVTVNRYDSAGNLTEQSQLAARYSGEATESAVTAWLKTAGNPTSDRRTTYAYDAAGRLAYTIDAEGYVTAQRYDAAGHVTSVVRYAAPAASDARGLSAAELTLRYPATNPADAVVTQYRYDKAGRLIEAVNALGTVTHYDLDELGRTVTTWFAYNNATYKTATHAEYDAAGRLLSETRAWGSPQAATTTYTYDGLGRVVTLIDPNGHTTTYGYDARGNRTSVSDALGHATTTAYDAFGNAVKVTDAKGNSSFFYFDLLNRNVLQVNAVGSVVSTEYNASGQPTKVTHYANAWAGIVDEHTALSSIRPTPNGARDAVTLLSYDKLDRLVQSTDAEGYSELFRYDAFGNRTGYTNKVGGEFAYTYDRRGLMLSETLAVTSNGQSVVNRFEYDARGNRVAVVEASGLPEQRVTRYEFDKLDRVTKQVGESVPVYNASTASWSTATPIQTYAYDARGNLAQQTDANGRSTFWYYDAADRRTAEVGPLGTLSAWTYDGVGNVTSQKVYGVAVTGRTGAIPPAPNTPANVRETRYAYDAADRLVETSIVNVNTGYYDGEAGTYKYDIRDIVTRVEYDALGLTIVSIDGNGNKTYSYYDKLGQKVLEVDAEGYAVAWSRDAKGDVVRETRFSGRPAAGYDVEGTASALLSLWPAGSDDRITDYTYDRNGRLTSESRLNVRYANVDGNGRLTEQVGSAVSRYVYDGEGHLIRRTDANGSQYDWTFDALGRQIRQQLPAFSDYLGRLVRTTTDYAYDGLNNVVSETERSADGNTANDHVTRYSYGVGGRLTSKTNAGGVTIDYGYDALGNSTLATFIRADADGVTRQDINYFVYNAAGQQTQRWSEGGPRTHTIYNVYGEVTAQGMYNSTSASASQLAYFAEYDNAGRVVKSNFDRGITRAYVYDANGNATLQLESQATNLRSLTMDQILSRSDVAQTFTLYDKRNLVLDVIQPEMSGSRDVLGLKGTQVGVAGRDGVSVIVGGGLSGVDTGTGEPGAPVNKASWRYVGDESISASFGLYVNYAAPAGGNGFAGNLNVNLPSVLSAIYGEYDARVVIDYNASNVDVQNLHAPGYVVSPGSSSGRLEYFGREGANYSNYVSARPAIQLKTKGQDGTFAYTIDVYIRIKSTGEEVKLSTFNDTLIVRHDAPEYSQVKSERRTAPLPKSNWLQLSSGTLSAASTTKLYVRPAGSSSAFTEIPVSNYPTTGSYGADLAFLTAGDYEFVFLAMESNGTLLRRDSFGLRVPDGTRLAGPSSGTVDAALQATTAGTFVVQQGAIDFYELKSSLGGRAVQATLQYRLRGSSDAYASVQLESLGALGGFRWNTRGMSLANYEIVLTVTDSGGGKNVLQGAANLTSDRISLLYAGVDTSKTLTFQNLPPSTAYLTISYRDPVTGSWLSDSQRWITQSGSYVWSAPSIMTNRPGSYPIRVTAFARDGAVVYDGSSVVTTGSQGTQLTSLYPNQASYTLSFDVGGFNDGLVMVLSYRAKGSSAPFSQVYGTTSTTKPPSGSLFRDSSDGTSMWHWDSAGLLEAGTEYEYFYEIYTGKPGYPTVKLLNRTDGTLTPQDPINSTQVLWEIKGLNNSAVTIHRQQSHNAFGDVDAEIDGRGNVTRLEYNTLGALLSRHDPEVDITLANGFIARVSPETRYYYDLAGNAVGMRDANGNLTTQRLNYGLLAPGVAQNWQGIRANGMSDGGTRVSGYDEFGNLRTFNEQVDGNTWRRTDYTYDKLSQLIRVDRPAITGGVNADRRAADIYEYDSAGNRIAHINALGLRDKTYYDYQGRVVQTVSAEGRNVTYTYTTQAMGTGWTIAMRDANGRTQVDVVDAYGRTTSHTNLGGRSFTYTYNFAGLIAKQTGSGQNIAYEYYANGLIRRMVDTAVGTDARYEYDRNGNRTFEGYTASDGRYVFQQSQVTYDALNRVIKIVDPRYTIDYEYDAVGNRIRMFSQYNDGITGAKAIQEYWYQYDAMNRFTVTMGQLVNGQRGTSAGDGSAYVVAGNGGDGVTVAYDLAGQRRQAIYAYDGHKEDYAYDSNGLLTDTWIDNKLRARRTNDLAGRVTSYEEWDASGAQITNLSRTWDGDNLLREERNNRNGTGTRYEYMADGTLSATQTYGEATTLRTTYEYEWWDSAKQKNIKVQASNQDVANWAPGFSQFTYDANGHVKSVFDASANRRFTYWTDGDGQVLQRDEIGNFNTARASHSYYYMGGHQVGNVGNDGVDRIDYAREMANTQAAQPGDDRWKRFTPTNSADFDVNYQPINSLYPGSAPGSHTIRTGETFQTLAAAYYGDATLWYIIADANGMDGADQLVAGMVLTIPNKVTNIHNTYATFKPYDPGKAIGNTQPTLPAPPPPPIVYGGDGRGGCGGLATVIAVVIAVVVTVVTDGAGASLLQTVLAGAGASAASQGVMIAAGEQHGFDWKGVALGAAAAGVAAGVGQAASSLGATNGFVSGAVQGAARSAFTQGIGVATGLQHSFDWKGVAVGAIAGGAAGAAMDKIGQWQYGDAWNGMSGPALRADTFNTAVRGLGAGLAAGTASTIARGGSVAGNAGAIARDAIGATIGSTIGNMVVDQMASRPTSTELRTQQAIDAMNGQILPGGVGSAGTGFVPANATYIRFDNSPSVSAATALPNYDSPAGIEQARAQRIAELQLLADQPLDQGFSGVQVLIEGVGSAGGPVSQPTAELGTIRNLSWFESQLAFNPVAQAAQGFVDQGLTLANGAWNVVSHPVNTVAAIGGHYANAYAAGDLGGTILRDASGIAAGAVKGALSPIDALYRQNEAGGAYRLGGSMMDAALSAATPGAVSAATRLAGAGLERGAAIFGPNLARMSETLLAKTGGLSYVVESPNVGSAGLTNLTERGTLTNLRPADPAVAQRPIRTLVQDEGGRYWLQGSGGNRITPSGAYDFVTMPNGTIRIARPNLNPDFSTHLGLSGAGEVNFAGSIRFSNNSGPSRGSIVSWTNSSGHYRPPVSLIDNAGLPIELFGQFNPFAPR